MCEESLPRDSNFEYNIHSKSIKMALLKPLEMLKVMLFFCTVQHENEFYPSTGLSAVVP